MYRGDEGMALQLTVRIDGLELDVDALQVRPRGRGRFLLIWAGPE